MATSWLIYFVLIGFCTAQYVIDYSEPVYQNTPSSSFVAIAPVGSPSSCSGNFFLLTNNTSSNDCFQISNNNHTIISRSCPTDLRGSTSLSCVPQLCFALNPSLRQVVMLHNNGTILSTFGSSQLLQPTLFTATQRNNTFAEVIVVDGFNIWMFTVLLTTSQVVTSRQVVTVPQQVIGILMSSNTSIILAYANSTSLTTYTITSNTFGNLGPQFGNIGSIITQDTYNRIYVYDSSCSCIKIISSAGILQCKINLINSPIFISERRNSIFIVDRASISKYVDNFHVSFNTKAKTCFLPLSSSIIANFYGGDYPFNFSVFPDNLKSLFTSPGNYTVNFTIGVFDYTTQPQLSIFADSFLKMSNIAGSLPIANRSIVASTDFIPHSGNASFGFTYNAVATANGQTLVFTFSASLQVALNASVYEFLTLWINVGEGGQYFKLDLGGVGNTYIYNPGDLQRNTWTKIIINLAENNNVRRVSGSTFTSITFTDLLKTANQNRIYLDDIDLIPYDFTSPNRKLYVFDACGIITGYNITLQDQVFKATINSTGVSCNAISTTSTNLTTDAIVNSYLENGIPPFIYNWTLNNITNPSAPNIPRMNSYITVYDNAINSSLIFTTIATAYSYVATTQYHSPPYSIAVRFTDELQSVSITFPQEMYFADYPIVELWFHGGDVGQQFLAFQFQRAGKPLSSIIIFNDLVSYYTMPPNKWIKIRYEAPANLASVRYNGLLITPTAYFNTIIADTFYIDDIIVYGKEILVVTDSTGCLTSTRTLDVPTPPSLIQSVDIQNVKCFGLKDGSANIRMNGGTPPYNYAWSNSVVNSPSISNLNASDIYVNVADSKGCEYFKKELKITQPPPMTINITRQPIKCNGGKTIASASTVGGNAPYTYIWSSGSSITPVAQLAPQPIFTESFSSQFVTLNGEVKCMGSRQEIQSSHSGYCSLFLPFGPSISNVSIVGCSNCMQLSKNSKLMFWIYITTREAVDQLQLQFLKSGEIISPSIPLSSLINTLSLEQWNEISLNLSISNNSAPDELMFTSSSPETMGTIILDDIVIIPVDIFSTGDSVFPGFNSFVEIVAAQYFISVVDANGCSSVKYNFTMTQPQAMSIYFTYTAPTSVNSTDGTIYAEAAGGTPPYSYLWDTNETMQTIQAPVGKLYKLQVIDSNGCTFEDSSYIPDSLNGIRTLRTFNSPLAGGLAAIIGAGLLVVLFAFVMLSMFWNSTGFSALGTFFSSTLLAGVLVGLAAAAVLLPKPTDQLCLAFPWLLGIAFILVYGCLFIKTWTLYRVWRRASNYQRTALTPAYIIIRIGIALLLEIVLLAAWTAIDPPRVTATNTVDNTMEYQCDTEHPTFWIIFLSTKGVWLLFGAVMSILTRNIAKEFNESENIAYAIYNNVVLLVIAIPLATLLKEIPGGRLVVEVVVVVLAFTFTTVVMFFKIWHRIILPQKLTGIPHHVSASKAATTASSSGGSSPASKKSKSSSDGNTSSAV